MQRVLCADKTSRTKDHTTSSKKQPHVHLNNKTTISVWVKDLHSLPVFFMHICKKTTYINSAHLILTELIGRSHTNTQHNIHMRACTH
mmetsp:Transcript_13388/g.36299  ORF Transcript_13388/g.36299 Transcript_13388/m.36299 type:complete len:88 (+) Transcript_13388:715-978(+)